MENLRNKIVFTATFFSKLAFGIFFTVACYFIQSDVVDNDMEAAIEICGGEDWYEDGKRNRNEVRGMIPWDEKVVNCLHNTRGGLFTAGAICLLLSILLEAKPALKKDGKFPLVMFLVQVVSSLLIFGAVVSEMEIMKRMKSTTSKIFNADDFEALFIIDYPKLSSDMWIVGFAFLLLGQLYNLFQHRHSRIRVLSTYTVAGLGSILLLIAGILRLKGDGAHLSGTFYNDSGDVVDQSFSLDTKFISDIVVLMISGSVFFIIHAVMFFFFLYDEVVLVTEEEDLSHEEIVIEEGQEQNPPLDIHEKDEDKIDKDLSHEEIAMEEGQD